MFSVMKARVLFSGLAVKPGFERKRLKFKTKSEADAVVRRAAFI